MKKIIKISLYVLIALFILLLAFMTYAFCVTKNTFFDENKLIKGKNTIEYYDCNDKIIDVYTNSNSYVSLSNLNKHTIDAFICVEDKRFYKHNGIDLIRILGAIKNNLFSFSLKEGASTISQQLIKNTHLSNEKTLNRKLNEVKLTLELEKKYSKNEIIEKYLNTIYFGGGAYGIQNASKLYFNKNASELTINESCMLAGLIKSPTNYSPFSNYENSIERKNIVLNLMLKENAISQNQYDKYLNETIKINKNTNSDIFRDYILQVFNEYENILSLNPYSQEKIKIYTYLDTDLQKEISTNIQNEYGYKQIVINSKNGGVIAYYGENSNEKRNVASCIKPIYIYAPMLNEKLITESTVIVDEEINYSGYSPSNYGNKFYGPVTVKTALSKSLNIPAVKLLDSFGIDKANNYMKKYNLNLRGNNLTSALGNIENGLTLKELTDCYSPFNNEGNYVKSSFINKIEINNNVIYQNKANSNQIFSSETAYIMNDMLKESVKSGTSKKLDGFDFDVCAKTGTNGNSDGNIDAYSISYTTSHLVGVWLGSNSTNLMPNTISGSTLPSMYAYNTLKYLYKNNKPQNFKQPENVVKVKVDNDVLLSEQKAYLSKYGYEYVYINGTQPTQVLENVNNSKIYDITIKNENNSIIINYKNNGYKGVEIYRNYNGKITKIYNGNEGEVKDSITNYGEYIYTLKPYKIDGKKVIYGDEILIGKIKYSKDSIKNQEWWND